VGLAHAFLERVPHGSLRPESALGSEDRSGPVTSRFVTRNFGPLNLRLEIDSASHFLRAVALPALPPAGLTAKHLLSALEALSALAILPVRSSGESSFQDTLQAVPPGQTRTYAQIAASLQTSPRAIGRWCAKNRLLLRIPCHRIVGKNTPGGFNAGMVWKQKLLDLEQDMGVFPAFSDLSPRLF
jgi:O-6-methylguanine DNA methyltransferase